MPLPLLVAFALTLSASAASAQSFPSKPIRVIVPLGAGGSSDLVARTLQPRLNQALGQQVVIEYRAGAGGAIGAEHVSKSAPDGYTLAYATASTMVQAPFLIKNVPYNTLKDFTPVVTAVKTVGALTANSALPVNSVKELLEYAKRNPGKLSAGNSGIGSTYHVAIDLLNKMSNADVANIPYKGGGPAVAAVLGGEVPLSITAVSTVMPHVKSGKLKVLAMIESERYSRLPDVPTVGETIPGFALPSGWHGYLGPAGMPRAAVMRFNAEAVKILQTPEVRDKLVGAGLDVVANTPEQFGEMLKLDFEAYARIVKLLGIKPE